MASIDTAHIDEKFSENGWVLDFIQVLIFMKWIHFIKQFVLFLERIWNYLSWSLASENFMHFSIISTIDAAKKLINCIIISIFVFVSYS